jgi:sulfate permease, SulP family
MSEAEGVAAVETPPDGWHALFPPAHWLPRYRGAWLWPDVVAGITLAAYAIPVSLAYASLAGLPLQHGIYCYLVAGIAYALFGSSRQLAVGHLVAGRRDPGRARRHECVWSRRARRCAT